MSARARPETTVIGAGHLARALLPRLVEAGYRLLAIAAPRVEEARAARRGLPRGVRATSDVADAVGRARLVLLAVPDREIQGVAERLAADQRLDWNNRVVLHHAGSLGTDPLQALARTGAAVGVLHPLQCLGSPRVAAEVLPGSSARIEGDRRAVNVARRLARDLGLVPLKFKRPATAKGRAAYHAAASIASNDVLALLHSATEHLVTAGLERSEAVGALAALARGTLRHIESGGFAAALTGPAARGDSETLQAHLDGLSARDPDSAEVHRLLSIRLARLAGPRGRETVRLLTREQKRGHR